jgi:ornithine carbamoyltransferase
VDLNRLEGRNLLTGTELTRDEFDYLIDLAASLRTAKRQHAEVPYLAGRNIALIFEKTSTRTRVSFEVAAHDQGAHVTYLGTGETQLGGKESVADTARVLGRVFDGIEYRGFGQERVDTLARHAGVPVWNGLTDEWHPTQMLADVLTIRDHADTALDAVTLCYCGDARNNTAHSLVVTGALLGMDIRIAAPRERWPDPAVRALADRLAGTSGARVTVTEDARSAVAGADFVYTDVWVSMGEPADVWDRRIDLLLPYQVNRSLLEASGNPGVKLLHCLPAFHDTGTEVGRSIAERRGLTALEVTDDVFESPASVVFDQAENRMHTIKALMVATLPT